MSSPRQPGQSDRCQQVLGEERRWRASCGRITDRGLCCSLWAGPTLATPGGPPRSQRSWGGQLVRLTCLCVSDAVGGSSCSQSHALGCWETPPSWKPCGPADGVPGSRAPWSAQVCAGKVGCADSCASSKLVLVTGLESLPSQVWPSMTLQWR